MQVLMPLDAAKHHLPAPATLGSEAGDQPTGLELVDDTPLTTKNLSATAGPPELTGSKWAFPLYTRRYSSLQVGANGIIQGGETKAPCPGFWANPGGVPLCWYTTSYKGIVAPLSTDWAPNQYSEASLSTRVTASRLCASWYNVGLYSNSPPSNVSFSGRTTAFDACMTADGGAAWWLKPIPAPGHPVPSSQQLVSGSASPLSGLSLPPNLGQTISQQWLSGVRSPDLSDESPATASERTSNGVLTEMLDTYFNESARGPTDSWLQPRQSSSRAAVQSQQQLLLKASAISAAQRLQYAIGTCALGTTACIASRCSALEGGSSIILHWSGLGCGLQPLLRGVEGAAARQRVDISALESLLSYSDHPTQAPLRRIEPFSWAPWFDAGVQIMCAFGHIGSDTAARQMALAAHVVNATVHMTSVQGASGDVGASAFRCVAPALAAVAGSAAATQLQEQAERTDTLAAQAAELAGAVGNVTSRGLGGPAVLAGLVSHVVPLHLLAVFPGSSGSVLNGDASVLVLPTVAMSLNPLLASEDIASLLPAATASRRRFTALKGRMQPLSVTYLAGVHRNASCGCGGGTLSQSSQCNTLGVCTPLGAEFLTSASPLRRTRAVQPISPDVLARPAAGLVDCAGEAFGTAASSACGACTGGSTGLPGVKDCTGLCGGTARADDCGLCAGGRSGRIPGASKDCAGVCEGTASLDCRPVCTGGSTGVSPATFDCSNVCAGTAKVDECDVCAGGTTRLLPCTPAGGGGSGGGGSGGGESGGGGGSSGGTSGGGSTQGQGATKNSEADPAITDAILLAAFISLGSALAVLGLCYGRMRWRQHAEFAVEAFDDFEARQHTTGLHQTALAALPTVEFSAALAEGPGGSLCTICQESFAKGVPVVELPCKHLFHEDCIRAWLQRRTTCVLCQYELAGWAMDIAPHSVGPAAAVPIPNSDAAAAPRAIGSSRHRQGRRFRQGGATASARVHAIELPTRRRTPANPEPTATAPDAGAVEELHLASNPLHG
jgi:hypothetical protein